MIEKPWGYEKILDLNDNYVVKLIKVKGGHRLSLQYHKAKMETLVVHEGEGTLYREGCSFYLGPGFCYTIQPKQKHRIEAWEKGLTIIEVSTPHLDDVVRLEDDYGRV